jgi:hypothetical protein
MLFVVAVANPGRIGRPGTRVPRDLDPGICVLCRGPALSPCGFGHAKYRQEEYIPGPSALAQVTPRPHFRLHLSACPLYHLTKMSSHTTALEKLHASGLFIQDSAFIDGDWVASGKTFDVYGASFYLARRLLPIAARVLTR